MDFFMMIPVAQAASAINDAKPVLGILSGVLNFLLSVIGVVGIIGVGISGFLYLTAAGDETQIRRAKQVGTTAAIGLVVALGALVLVTQLSSFFA